MITYNLLMITCRSSDDCMMTRLLLQLETEYLEHDFDIVSIWVRVQEGEFKRDSVGVEEGARLKGMSRGGTGGGGGRGGGGRRGRGGRRGGVGGEKLTMTIVPSSFFPTLPQYPTPLQGGREIEGV